MTAFLKKFGPKGSALTPNRNDAHYTFHTQHAVQSATADLLVSAVAELIKLSVNF